MNTLNLSGRLPSKLRQIGLELTATPGEKLTKFVLKCKDGSYRGFTYVRNDRDADGSLKDLYNNYLYETGATFSLVGCGQ